VITLYSYGALGAAGNPARRGRANDVGADGGGGAGREGSAAALSKSQILVMWGLSGIRCI